MRILVLLLFISACARQPVQVNCSADQQECPENQVCTLVFGQGKCQKTTLGEKPFQGQLPFDPIQPVLCRAGLSQNDRRYKTETDTFSLLLGGLRELAALKVKAMAAGTAHIYDECPNKDSSTKQHQRTTCGLGLGNHVRIIHDNGYMSVYAHLSEILIQNGEKVKAGQDIAIEGASGDVRSRGVRISVHRPWSPGALLKQAGQTGRSLPFLLFYRIAEEDNATWRASTDVQCGAQFGAKFMYSGNK